MNTPFRELLAFHVEAQLGMFIDSFREAGDGAGLWVFSAREDDPSWNVFYALDVAKALGREDAIAREFARHSREPVWYVADAERDRLPAGWKPFSSDRWMVCGAPDAAREACPLDLRLVETGADAEAFDRLYVEAFWDGIPDPDAILPASGKSPDPATRLVVRHWLGYEAGHPLTQLTAIVRDGVVAIYNVGTLPSERGRGLGSSMMRRAMAEEVRRGARLFFLSTERDKPLESFYGGVGFRTVLAGQYYRKGPVG